LRRRAYLRFLCRFAAQQSRPRRERGHHLQLAPRAGKRGESGASRSTHQHEFSRSGGRRGLAHQKSRCRRDAQDVLLAEISPGGIEQRGEG
jgi:hypothetical protein